VTRVRLYTSPFARVPPRLQFICVTDPEPNPADLLHEAKAKAERLLASLLAQRQDLDRQAVHVQLDPTKLALGREAFANAIDAARRTVHSIDAALKLTSSNPDNRLSR
jgi:hypothetical protein